MSFIMFSSNILFVYGKNGERIWINKNAKVTVQIVIVPFVLREYLNASLLNKNINKAISSQQ